MNNSVFKCLLTIALVFSCNIMQAVTKNIREYNLNGNVYCIRVKEYSFYLEFGEMNRGTQKSEYSTYFLKNGNVFIDSLVPQKTYKRYFYDKFNNLTEEMRINVGAGRKIQLGNGNYHYNDTTNHVLYKYNYSADGRIKEILKYIKMRDDVLTQIQRIEDFFKIYPRKIQKQMFLGLQDLLELKRLQLKSGDQFDMDNLHEYQVFSNLNFDF